MTRRVKINLTFSADLDGVPGWGHQPQDWVDLIRHELMRNAHYRTEVEIHSVEVRHPQSIPNPSSLDALAPVQPPHE
jgi:hypothetical protein